MRKIFLIIFLTVNASANTLEIVSENILKHGDSANIVLRISQQVDEVGINQAIEKSEKKIGPFYIFKVGFIKAEAGQTVVGLNVFYDDPRATNNISLQLAKPISLSLVNREKLNPEELKPEMEFQYYIRKFNIPNEWDLLYFLLSFVFIFIGAILLKRYLEQQRILKAEREYIENWKRAFKACYKRDDYERIYKERDKWIPLVGRSGKRFIKTLNKHQYKKEWTQDDMAQVTNEFNKLKEKIVNDGV